MGEGVWHEAMVLACLPLAAPIGLLEMGGGAIQYNECLGRCFLCNGAGRVFLKGGGVWNPKVQKFVFQK